LAIFGKKGKKALDAALAAAPERLPKHVAIIMDGNGRWAESRGLPRPFGHRAGVEALRTIIRLSSDLGITALTLYAFSTENWQRPEGEVGALMALLVEFLEKEIDELHENGVNIRILGEPGRFPQNVLKAITRSVEITRENKGLIVNIALNYGGRAEITKAAALLLEDIQNGKAENVSEEAINDRLYTAGIPEPDLLIRPGGEFRISNFMLWQLAYCELYFTDTLWPDFGAKEYIDALKEYASRQRRFGGV
jgi:undecaprenyl diphosphate synthase